MFQFAMALLITASLLVCPLRCQLHAEADAGNNAAVVSGCSCCHSHDQQAPASQSEGCPDGDCDCSGCICEGAVLEHHDSLDAPAPTMLLVFLGSAPPCQPIVTAVELRELDQQMPHSGQFLNGRAARLAQHSLLI